jgi:hypothetical protein
VRLPSGVHFASETLTSIGRSDRRFLINGNFGFESWIRKGIFRDTVVKATLV